MTKIKNFLALLLVLFSVFSYAQNCVTGDCNPNTYLNSSDPNTIEYDNMISLYHSSMVRESDGTVKIWGSGTRQNASMGTGQNYGSPTVVNGTNYGSGANKLTGKVLKMAGASYFPWATPDLYQQYCVLTENGLYLWGDMGVLASGWGAANNIATGSFRKATAGTYGVAGLKADGLPAGVSPQDVKMMFGSHRTLAIVTCSGQAWVLASDSNAYGDGTSGAGTSGVWHRVSTAAGVPLENVVAVRGNASILIALTSDGELYTWGLATRLGGTNPSELKANRPFATQMIKPAGITPKMIGITTATHSASPDAMTYFLLATNGKLYAMGAAGSNRMLGDGTNIDSDIWKEVTATNTINGTTYTLGGNIAWISPGEHHYNTSSINVITSDAKLWAWGNNHRSMLGVPTPPLSNLVINPTYMPGSISGAYNAGKLNLTDRVLAIESGGHTTIAIKGCANKYGYVGHRIDGSMGGGSGEADEVEYNFSQTGILSICGATTVPDVKDIKKCASATANLANAEPAILPPNTTIEWWLDAAGTIPVPNPAAVQAGVYYASLGGIADKCIKQITVSNYVATDPEYATCNPFVCPPDPYAAQQTWWLPGNTYNGVNKVRIDFQTGSAVLNDPPAGFLGQGGAGYGEASLAVTHPVTGELIFVTDGNIAFRGSDGIEATGDLVGGNRSAGEPVAVIPDPNGILGRNFIIFGNGSGIDGGKAGPLNMAKYDVKTNVVSGLTTLLSGAAIYEALEVIPHTNGDDYWILVNTADQKVKSFLYTKAGGFNATPVSSINVANLSGVNPLLISPGSFISWDPRNPNTLLIGRHDRIGLSTFDPSTGAIGAFSVKITTPNTGNPVHTPETYYAMTGYSAALSANGKFIYYSLGARHQLYQYNIATGKSYIVGQGAAVNTQGIKLAPDGRVYFTNNDGQARKRLYYFDNPEVAATANNTAISPLFAYGAVTINLPNNVYWGCATCQAGTAAPALTNTNISPAPATVGDLIAQLSASNMPAGTAFTIHTDATATDTNKLADNTAIVPGTTYYVAFYDGLSVCYSPTTEVSVAAACFNDPATGGSNHDTKVGITLLKRAGSQNADNWPMVRKSGHIALESNTQGFVVTRMTTAQLTAIKDAKYAVEGMMSYDTDAKCLKIYDGTDWKCFSTPSCP